MTSTYGRDHELLDALADAGLSAAQCAARCGLTPAAIESAIEGKVRWIAGEQRTAFLRACLAAQRHKTWRDKYDGGGWL